MDPISKFLLQLACSSLCGPPGLARGLALRLEAICEVLEVTKALIGLLGPGCGAGPVLPLHQEQRLGLAAAELAATLVGGDAHLHPVDLLWSEVRLLER